MDRRTIRGASRPRSWPATSSGACRSCGMAMHRQPQFRPEKPDDGIVLRQVASGQAQANVTVTFSPALIGKTADLLDSALENSIESVEISDQPWPLLLRKGLHVIRVGESHTQFLILRGGKRNRCTSMGSLEEVAPTIPCHLLDKRVP